MRRLLAVSALVLGLSVAAPQAQADYFVWTDPQSKLSITYPDTWRAVSNQHANDILTLMPPSGRANAQCRVNVEDERRFLIYPQRFDSAIQRVAFSHEFWDKYLNTYNDYQIEALYDGAGLGRGWGSYVLASYRSAVPGPEMNRRAVMFVSHYNDKVYVTECSTHAAAFDEWKHIFLSVAGSVNFRKEHHEMATGHYRNYLADPNLVFIDTDGNKRPYYE